MNLEYNEKRAVLAGPTELVDSVSDAKSELDDKNGGRLVLNLLRFVRGFLTVTILLLLELSTAGDELIGVVG